MASTHASLNGASNTEQQPPEFELRRAALVGEIGDSLESVLTQINALNRSLEGIIEIGNEFASVEALWSQFEAVMGRSEASVEGAQELAGEEEGDRRSNDEQEETTKAS